MQIVVGSIQQETNTFNPELTGLNDFLVVEGEAMLSRIAVSDYLKAEGCTIHPTLYANALTPGASCETIEQIPYTRIRRPIYPLDQDFDWQASGGSR